MVGEYTNLALVAAVRESIFVLANFDYYIFAADLFARDCLSYFFGVSELY